MAKRSDLEWSGGPPAKPTEGLVQSIGLNSAGPTLAVAPTGKPDTTEQDRLHDCSLEDGMAVDVQRIHEADHDTRPSGRIPLL